MDRREVEGIVNECRANAENCVRAMAVWRERSGGVPYIHLTPRRNDGADDNFH